MSNLKDHRILSHAEWIAARKALLVKEKEKELTRRRDDKDPAAPQVFHTYSTYARGLDMLNVAYHYLDLVPKGRDEEPKRGGRWVRRWDEYDDASARSCHGEATPG